MSGSCASGIAHQAYKSLPVDFDLPYISFGDSGSIGKAMGAISSELSLLLYVWGTLTAVALLDRLGRIRAKCTAIESDGRIWA